MPCVTSLHKNIHICRLLFVTGLFFWSVCVAASDLPSPGQPRAIPNEPSLSGQPGLVNDWANRLLDNDPKIRKTTEAVHVEGGNRSLPLLSRFLRTTNEHLHQKTFGIVRRIGPD